MLILFSIICSPKVAVLLEDRIDDFALAESRDQGKPVSLARNMDMRRAVVNLRAFAEAWKSHVGTSNEVGIVGNV